MLTPAFPQLYPAADAVMDPARLVKGEFIGGRPTGITIHHAADRRLDVVRLELEQKGLGYHIIIDREGKIYSNAYLTHRVWHAGKAVWRGLSPNSTHLAISLLSWGEVKPIGGAAPDFKAWSGVSVAKADVAHRQSNTKPGQELFYWDAATQPQLDALKRVCLWCVQQGIDPQHICGHDECALPIGRKSDPGGVLPFTMAEFRLLLSTHASTEAKAV